MVKFLDLKAQYLQIKDEIDHVIQMLLKHQRSSVVSI